MTQDRIQLIKISNDTNGNPRYVTHFFNLLSSQEKMDIDRANRDKGIGASITAMYEAALKKAKKIRGKKFHNKSFGGGIVFISFNTQDLEKQIEFLKA